MKKNNRFYAIFNCYKIIFLCSPALAICEIVSYFGAAVISGLMPLIWKNLFDAIPMSISDKSITPILIPIIWFASFQIFEVIFRLLGRLPARVFGYNEKVVLSLKYNLYEHACNIPLIEFENIDNYEIFERANSAISNNAATKMVDYLYQTPAMIFSLFIMSITLWTFNPLLVVIAVISIIPISIFMISKSFKQYKLLQSQVSDRRIKNYFWSLFLSPNTIKDIRVSQSQDFFKEKWLASCKKINYEDKQFCVEHLKKQIVPDIFKIVGNCFGIILTALLLFLNKISIGSFGAVIIAFQNLQDTYIRIVSNFQEFRSSYLFFNDYLAFMDIPKEIYGQKYLNEISNIELQNVSFKYPNSNELTLKNISLSINKNEHIAIVGENGSGKTTLCRILTGLYSPSGGVAKYNNISICEYNNKNMISVVFQDYTRFMFDIRSNVGFGDIENMDNDSNIYIALQKADFLDIFNDLNSQLGREFNGKELSIGQWQRLAIARGYMSSKKQLYIFDEPTSAIDPIQEFNIFNNFIKQTINCTSIIVTHRIGAAKLANRIIVMHKGEIVEQGTHFELMNLNGKYASMYNDQAKWYLDL